MELSIILMQQIGSLFIMIIIGYFLVKKGLCKEEDSKVLSNLLLYIAAPCAVINSFQIERTPDKMQGLLLAIIAAILIHILYMISSYFLGKWMHFSAVEKAAVMYSNCGNLIIPLVTVMLGPEMTFYTCGYMMVQTILLWTHCKFLISEERSFDLKKIIYNINILSIGIGILLFVSQISLPTVASSAIKSLSNLMGPLSMIIVGMLLANVNFSTIIKDKRSYLISLFRLIVLPILVLVLFKITNLASFTPNGKSVLMISLLAASAPSASTITQFALLYNKNPKGASVTNTITVISCIITMPVLLFFYTILIGN